MKAVILAAGKGVRLLPLTEMKPKVMVEVLGKPFLQYVVEQLHAAGCLELGIVVGYKKEKIVEFLSKNKIKATIIEQREQWGTGDALKQAREFCGQDQFILQGGDDLFSVSDLRAVSHEDTFCYVVGKEVPDWQKYGVLLVQGEQLVKIIEKPKEFVGNVANTALYKFTPEIFGALERVKLSPRGEYELTDAVTILAQQGKVKVLMLKGQWLGLGSKEDVGKIEKFLRMEGL